MRCPIAAWQLAVGDYCFFEGRVRCAAQVFTMSRSGTVVVVWTDGAETRFAPDTMIDFIDGEDERAGRGGRPTPAHERVIRKMRGEPAGAPRRGRR